MTILLRGPIIDEAEHKAAITALTQLMDIPDEERAPALNAILQILAAKIERYEKKRWPMPMITARRRGKRV